MDLSRLKEKGYLPGRRFGCIGAMNCIFFHVGTPLASNGALCRLGWIRGTHDLAILGDGVLSFKDRNEDRSGGYILCQA